jgi:hypothetical protein
MPMNFTDFDSLKQAALVHGFRKCNTDESEEEYRKTLAEHVIPKDRIEGFEILFGKGWDQWSDKEKGIFLGP